ncbi:MAG: adenylate/guanylate cyclase domain-containing protein [bacterium]|nr:adenylate/guanylate cyclase domain-containing protein [bacterium]
MFPILGSEFNIGRLPESDLCLPEVPVSRKHCQIRREEDSYILADLESLNGTTLNGAQVKTAELRDGDVIQVGNSTLVFHQPESRTARPGPDEQPPPSPSLPPPPRVEKSSPDPDLDWAEIARRVEEMRSDDSKLVKPEFRNFYLLRDLCRVIIQANSEEDLLEVAMDGISRVFSFQVAGIFLRDPKVPNRLVPKFILGTNPKNPEISTTILKYAGEKNLVLLSTDARTDPRLLSGDSISDLGIHSALAAPLWDGEENFGVIYLSTRKPESSYRENDLELLSALANLVAAGIRKLKLREGMEKEQLLRSHLEHYHSPEVIDLIMKQASDSEGKIPATVREITILFADIRNFTSLSENLPPPEIAELLNEFFAYSTETIFRYHGSLNKFLGDGLMAIFGAPLPRKNHAESAVRTALDLMRETEKYCARLPVSKRFAIKIGINTGEVVVGSFGNPKRMEYTALGDEVNTASRLESTAEAGQILISERTREMIRDLFPTREIGYITLKGKARQVKVFEVITGSGRTPENPPLREYGV